MRKVAAFVLALLLVPALALAALIEGTVSKVDKAKNQVVVKTDKGSKTFLISEKTQGAESLKEGAKVSIQYSEKGGQLRATAITVGKAK